MKKTSFLHKILKNFQERGHNLLPKTYSLLFRPLTILFQICGFDTYWDVLLVTVKSVREKIDKRKRRAQKVRAGVPVREGSVKGRERKRRGP